MYAYVFSLKYCTLRIVQGLTGQVRIRMVNSLRYGFMLWCSVSKNVQFELFNANLSKRKVAVSIFLSKQTNFVRIFVSLKKRI